MCDLLGITLKDEKCRISGTNNFLGLTVTFPARVNNYTLTISLTPDKSVKWKRILDNVICDRTISHAVLEWVIGRLWFAQNAVFARFARCMLQPLYAKLYSAPYYMNIHGKTPDTFQFWPDALTMLPPRVISKRVNRPEFILYTDASFENGSGMLGAILFDKTAPLAGGKRVTDSILSSPSTPAMIELFPRTSTIFGLELIAVTMAIYQLRFKLLGKSAVVFVDNNAVLGAIAKGQTAGNPAHGFISSMWMIAATLSMSLWFERAPTGVNIADLPTRFRTPDFPIKNESGYIGLDEWVQFTNRVFPHRSSKRVV